MQYDVRYVRDQFPATKLQVNGRPAVFLDGPGGTQVPQRVIDAMVHYLVHCNANAGGTFLTSVKSDQVIKDARLATAQFLGAEADEVAFGQNTTTLMFQLALALGREKSVRDEILITEIDHEANRGPWLALEDRGFKIIETRFDTECCTIDLEDYKSKLSDKTLVAAFNYASNAVGTISDIKEMVRLAHDAGAITVVDAVHFALHGVIDVKDINTDYLLCSAYKFFGPHIGILYGKMEVFEKLPAYRLRVQYNQIPYLIETGTLNHEGIAGTGEAVEFIAHIGSRFGNLPEKETGLRERIVAGMEIMEQHEQPLAAKLINELKEMERIKVYGPPEGHPRTSTVSFTIDHVRADKAAEALGEQGYFLWDGHFYAARLVERLGLMEKGGLIRVGLAPYNTEEEIEGLISAVRQIAG